MTDPVPPMAEDVLRQHAEGRIKHRLHGRCPDSVNGPDTRDPSCPVCQALDRGRTPSVDGLRSAAKSAKIEVDGLLVTGEPQTQAGRALLGELVADDWDEPLTAPMVLAIEAEAIAQERERLAAAVRDFRTYQFKEAPYGDEPHTMVLLSAVLALLQGADR